MNKSKTLYNIRDNDMHANTPKEILTSSNKVLFLTHLAIGDFMYWQPYFKAFHTAYPHLEIHIWVDELRRTRCFWRWKHLKYYALFDWLETCPYITHIYKKNYSPSTYHASLQEAQNHNYPCIISLANIRPTTYIKLAKKINPKSYIAAITTPTKWYQFFRKNIYRRVNTPCMLSQSPNKQHISDTYAHIIETLGNIHVAESERNPCISIPNTWILYAKLRFLKWGIDKKHRGPFSKIFFINIFAKDKKRCWTLRKLLECITTIKQQDSWGDVSFIINTTPEHHQRVIRFFTKHAIRDIFIFTAKTNFFQLPAVISLCDAIISVETSTIHLASALKKPTIALMRTKNPEWAPKNQHECIIVFAPSRKSWIKDIPPQAVLNALQDLDEKCKASCNNA